MATTRKQYSPKFKARVVTEASRGERTLSQLGSEFKAHLMQIAKWWKAALRSGASGWRDIASAGGRGLFARSGEQI
jgi:transposase